jgi:hypothetical protein
MAWLNPRSTRVADGLVESKNNGVETIPRDGVEMVYE